MSEKSTNVKHGGSSIAIRIAGCLAVVTAAFMICGCSLSRGYISSYSDNINKKAYSMTAVTVDFSSYASLYTEKEVLAVPGEGASLNIGSVKGAALYDLDGGRTLVEENITEKLYPASMTKIMTALLAIKYGKMDQVLTASSRLGQLEWEAQRIGIEKGDTMTLEQALNYLMVYSANDAAILIAESVGNGYDNFIRMMNKEAQSIGALNTHFVNPHGLHDDNHYTTPYDLYLIFRECIKYPEFRRLMDQSYYATTFYSKNKEARHIEIPSTDNYLIGSVRPPSTIRVLGGKTGTTDQAGSCLIILSKNAEGREFISEIFGAPDHASLYESMNILLRQEKDYNSKTDSQPNS